jgi:hypothetical protein
MRNFNMMQETFNITNAKYISADEINNTSIECHIDGVLSFVPLTAGNRHYDEIMRQVEAGELTIADAD